MHQKKKKLDRMICSCDWQAGTDRFIPRRHYLSSCQTHW